MKAYGHGMVWDADTNSVLVTFKKGEAEVNAEVARKLKALGYELDGDVAEPEAVEVETPEAVEAEADEPTDEAKSRRRK